MSMDVWDLLVVERGEPVPPPRELTLLNGEPWTVPQKVAFVDGMALLGENLKRGVSACHDWEVEDGEKVSEKDEAARDGATLHRNSGRGVIEKGDASLYPFTVDYKEYNETFGVSRKVWSKCTADALRMRNEPALKLVLGSENKTPVRLWVIGDEMFHEMREAWLEKYGDQSR